MGAVVWYSSWQMECCGDEFEVGADVTLTVGEDPNDEWFSAALGPEMAATITHVEDHHGDHAQGLAEICGRVEKITAVWGAFGLRSPDDRALSPLPGTQYFVDVDRTNPGVGSTNSHLTFNGWIVELAPPLGPPPPA